MDSEQIFIFRKGGKLMKWGLNIVGVLLALIGAIWFLQGVGVLQGSVMSNQTQWLVIGLIVLIVGVGLLVYGNRPPQARS
jgi:membrane protease YdiL (CAAX protease family)